MATFWENKCSFGLRYVFMVQYKYPIGNLVFSHHGFWSGNLFLRLFLVVAYLYLFILAASHLGLYCFSISHNKDMIRLINMLNVKNNLGVFTYMLDC